MDRAKGGGPWRRRRGWAAAELAGVDRNHDSGHDFDSGWAWERAGATANVIEGSSRGADAAEGKLGDEGWSGCSGEQIPAIESEREGEKGRRVSSPQIGALAAAGLRREAAERRVGGGTELNGLQWRGRGTG